MVHDLDLPMFLWVEAHCTEICILNRCPRELLKDITPKEAFIWKNLEVLHFRVFKSQIYIHVPKEKRMKLEPSSLEGILVSYSDSSKAYKIYVHPLV
jgi:hypothetical protein